VAAQAELDVQSRQAAQRVGKGGGLLMVGDPYACALGRKEAGQVYSLSAETEDGYKLVAQIAQQGLPRARRSTR
jgi:hypothetical protein